MKEETKVVKGYKVFNPDFTCNGYQFKVNETFEHKGELKICSSGFHFCLKASDCFNYYYFTPENIVCEVEALGDVRFKGDDSKACTNILRIIRILDWQEVLLVANEGMNNTGHSNSGNRNSGNRNSGNRNSGDWNSGDSNSGDWNSGDSNSGNSNSGNRNSGDWNSGDSNSGDWNSGDSNSGNRNSGDWNSGDRNSGDWNSGDSNSGNRNSGDWNSGDRNSGDSNSGYRNSGNRNSGDWNSGDRNSGDSNSGYRNSGAFSNDKSPILYLFNKPTSISVVEWERHPAVSIMSKFLDTTIWVPMSIMTNEEKVAHPKYETTEGFLKIISLKEAWSNMWNNLSEENKNVFLTLPNFDAEIFEDITGIKHT